MPGYAEAVALPTLSLASKMRAWHANVPTAKICGRARVRPACVSPQSSSVVLSVVVTDASVTQALALNLSFEDPVRRRSAEEQGCEARRLIKLCRIDCVYHFPAPFRMTLFTATGELAGHVQFDVLTRYINAVCVRATHRRKGVGSLLLHAAMEYIAHMQLAGGKAVNLYVSRDNAHEQPFLVDFYKHHGFEGDADGGKMHLRDQTDRPRDTAVPPRVADTPVKPAHTTPRTANAKQSPLPQLLPALGGLGGAPNIKPAAAARRNSSRKNSLL